MARVDRVIGTSRLCGWERRSYGLVLAGDARAMGTTPTGVGVGVGCPESPVAPRSVAADDPSGHGVPSRTHSSAVALSASGKKRISSGATGHTGRIARHHSNSSFAHGESPTAA